MALGPSSRLGPYELKSLLGRGGMGEVYRGWDSRLRREVAVKILPEMFSTDADRLHRFEQEARAAAALNHPNIVAVFDVGTQDGTPYVVSELLEGHTLRETMEAGLPLRKALDYAIQIASGLAAAHDKGIVHRDIKPENAFVTSDGRVKILDFGLAKLREEQPGGATATATLAAHSTAGMVIGTAGYMSPEQVRGEPVDHRTDIFSFGATLYEMVSGARAFSGDSAIETLHAILNSDPSGLHALETTKPGIGRIVQHCLEKNAAQRFQSARDLTFALQQLSGSGSAIAVAPPSAMAGAPSSARRGASMWATGALVLAILAGLSGWLIGRQPPGTDDGGAVHLSIPFVESPRLQPYGFRRLAISHDGQRVAYASLNRLWIRRFDEKNSVAIGPAGVNPFFSPDGRWVGFVNDGGVIKVPVEGGPPSMIATTSGRSAGAAWGPDDTIVFATTGGLYQVSSSGGEPRLLLGPNRDKRERLYAWPEFLPGGRSMLFTIMPEDATAAPSVAVLDLPSREHVVVLNDARSARYVPTGHIVYVSTSGIRAVGFDPGSRQIRGESVAFPDLDVAASSDNGASDFAISDTGTFVSLSASALEVVGGDLEPGLNTLHWIDHQGNTERIGIEPGSYAYPRVSPDGTRVALDMTGSNRDIWILNLERLTLTQLTNGPTEDLVPEWSPDGRRVFFSSDRTGDFEVYSQAADGATAAVLEFAAPGFQSPQTFTPGGDRLVVYDLFKDLSLITLNQPRRLEPLLHNDTADERVGRLSRDGKWIVYESDESGKQFEIFLRAFPDVSARREKVSVDGGRYPRWDPKGSSIFYVSLNGDMMEVPVAVAPDLKLGAPRKLFAWRKPPDGRSSLPYDISPLDGRFLVTQPRGERTGPTDVSVILNWFSELRRLANSASK